MKKSESEMERSGARPGNDRSIISKKKNLSFSFDVDVDGRRSTDAH